MSKCWVLFSSLLVACNPLLAAENYSYICTLDDNQRTIEVVYLEQDKPAPCEVRYIKDSVSQVLWSARRQEGFCELKAEAFMQKQTGWGWSCSRETEKPSSPESNPDG